MFLKYFSRFFMASCFPVGCELLARGGVLGGMVALMGASQPSLGQDVTAVHPERGGLLLETEEQRDIPKKVPAATVPIIDSRLSIFVTDKQTLAQITFKEVMEQLANQSGDTNLTAKNLFNTWWDSADTAPGAPGIATPATRHCDVESPPDATTRLTTLGGFPYRCPRPEKKQAAEDPSDPAAPEKGYIPIAYSNRFDLADPAGRDCGEYRIVFARVSGVTNPGDRNLIIFEARVKNPAPPITLANDPTVDPSKQGPPNSMANLKGCKPIIDAWAALSRPGMTTVERGKLLHDLYLVGIPDSNVGPFISVDNYRGDGQGQIRTNQFLDHGSDSADPAQANQAIWTLREFKIARVPAGTSAIQIVPQTVKANPSPTLFDAENASDKAAQFFDQVIGQLGPLRGGLAGERNINTFSYNNPDTFNSFESDESSNATVSQNGRLGSAFLQFQAKHGVLYGRLKQALTEKSSALTPEQIVARVQTQTCAGCHRFSNKNLPGPTPNPGNDLGGGLNWTQSLGFTHESEGDFEGGPDGNASRFLISDLLKDVFLPARLDNMRRFLAQP